jgi:membrane protein
VDGTEIAAVFAYRLAAAFIPFLIFITAAAALVIEQLGGDEPARNAITQLDGLLSDDVARGAEEQLRQVINSPSGLALAGGLIATLWTGLVGGQSVIRQLNTIHELEDSRGRARLAAVALSVSLASSLAATLAVVLLVFLGELPSDFTGSAILTYFLSLLRWPAALMLLTVAAALAYGLAPARTSRPVPISAGALLFGLTWTIASGLLVAYVVNVDAIARTYGALTGVVVMLAWVYVTGIAFVAGAVLDAEIESSRG